MAKDFEPQEEMDEKEKSRLARSIVGKDKPKAANEDEEKDESLLPTLKRLESSVAAMKSALEEHLKS